MKKSIVENQINEMAQALKGLEEDVETHFLARQTTFKWGPDWVETNMCFNRGKPWTIREEGGDNLTPTVLETFNCPEDPRIIMPNEGNSKIFYQEGYVSSDIWVEEKLNPEQQQVLNEYSGRARKILQIMIDDITEDEEHEGTNEEDEERALAEGGLNLGKYPKFQELLRRTLVMSQSAGEDMKLMEELSPDDLEIRKNRETMEAAFNCLIASRNPDRHRMGTAVVGRTPTDERLEEKPPFTECPLSFRLFLQHCSCYFPSIFYHYVGV